MYAKCVNEEKNTSGGEKKNRRLNVLREIILQGFPGGLAGKNLSANIRDTGDVSLILSGRSPGGGSGNLLQYSCLEISMDRRALWATIHWVAKSWIWLSSRIHRHTNGSNIVWVGKGWTSLEVKATHDKRNLFILTNRNMTFKSSFISCALHTSF